MADFVISFFYLFFLFSIIDYFKGNMEPEDMDKDRAHGEFLLTNYAPFSLAHNFTQLIHNIRELLIFLLSRAFQKADSGSQFVLVGKISTKQIKIN